MKSRKNIALLFCIVFGVLILFYGYIELIRYGDHWKQRTTPLPQETIIALCTNFNLEKNHALCNGSKDKVYGPDFYKIIRDTFRPYETYGIPSSESATYNNVEEKIGIFKYNCGDVIQELDGFTYFRCQYDLRGDREFIIGILFTLPDNAVFRINTPMGFDGE